MDGDMNRRKYFKTNACSKSETGLRKEEQSFREAWYRQDALQQPTAMSAPAMAEMPLDLMNKRSCTIQTERQETNDNNKMGINIIEDKIIKHKLPEVCIPPKNHSFTRPVRNFYEPISPPSPEGFIHSDANDEPVQHEIHILTGPEYNEYLKFKDYYEKTKKENDTTKEKATLDPTDKLKNNIRQQHIEEIIGLSDGYKQFLFQVMNIILAILEIPKKKKYQGLLGQLCTLRRSLMLDIIKSLTAIFLLNESTMELLEMFMNIDIPEKFYDILIKEFSIYKDLGVDNIDEEIAKLRNLQKNKSKEQKANNPSKTTKSTQHTNDERPKDSMAEENQRDWSQVNDMYMNSQRTVHQENIQQHPMEYNVNNRQVVHTYLPYQDRNQNVPYDHQQRMQASANIQAMPNETQRNPSSRRQMPTTNRTANLPPVMNSTRNRYQRAAVVLPHRPVPPEQYHTGNYYPVYNNQNQHPMMPPDQNYLNMPYL